MCKDTFRKETNNNKVVGSGCGGGSYSKHFWLEEVEMLVRPLRFWQNTKPGFVLIAIVNVCRDKTLCHTNCCQMFNNLLQSTHPQKLAVPSGIVFFFFSFFLPLLDGIYLNLFIAEAISISGKSFFFSIINRKEIHNGGILSAYSWFLSGWFIFLAPQARLIYWNRSIGILLLFILYRCPLLFISSRDSLYFRIVISFLA